MAVGRGPDLGLGANESIDDNGIEGCQLDFGAESGIGLDVYSHFLGIFRIQIADVEVKRVGDASAPDR